MGQSFHWMNQEKVLSQLYDLIEKKGGLVIVGSEHMKQNIDTTRNDGIVKNLITEYLGTERRAGQKTCTHPGKLYE